MELVLLALSADRVDLLVVGPWAWDGLVEVLDLVLHVDLLVVVSADAEAVEAGLGGAPRRSWFADFEV